MIITTVSEITNTITSVIIANWSLLLLLNGIKYSDSKSKCTKLFVNEGKSICDREMCAARTTLSGKSTQASEVSSSSLANSFLFKTTA